MRNHQRDGLMNVNQDLSPVNYEPNSSSKAASQEDPAYREIQVPLQGHVTREKIEKTDDYTQAGELFRSFTPAEQRQPVG